MTSKQMIPASTLQTGSVTVTMKKKEQQACICHIYSLLGSQGQSTGSQYSTLGADRVNGNAQGPSSDRLEVLEPLIF